MGKLHTLRRAIERDPDKWRGAYGASRGRDGNWYPIRFWSGAKSYRPFIRKTLKELSRRSS